MLELQHADYRRQNLGSTAENGVLRLQDGLTCTRGMIIKATPASAWYKSETKSMDCSDPEEIVVQMIIIRDSSDHRKSGIIRNLVSNILSAVRADDGILLALLYNDLSKEIESESDSLSRDYADRAAISFAKETGFPGVATREEPGSGLSLEFFSHVKRFQGESGIEPNGRLDYVTLAYLADRDIHWFRHHKYKDTNVALRRSVSDPCTSLDSVSRGDISADSVLINRLLETAKQREKSGEHGTAALLYNEALSRMPRDDVSKIVERAVYENIAEELELPFDRAIRCDPEQARFVMTPEMINAVRVHQNRVGLDVTGTLGYSTLNSFSGADVGSFLNPSYE